VVTQIDYWNHNVHYQPVILRAVPPGRMPGRGGPGGERFGRDWLAGLTGVPAALFYRAIRGQGNPGAPVKDPDMTWGEVRSAARRVLPGVRWRRHLLWRYSLRWRKPEVSQ
jgi:hypothetical protein